VIIPSHRGTGKSTPLLCENDEEDQVVATPSSECIAHLRNTLGDEYLNAFSVTNAAHDLAAVVSATREGTGGQQVSIFGVSYGSYLVSRFLYLYPHLANSAVLEGMCPPEVCELHTYDTYANAVGENFLSMCAKESDACVENLGRFPGDEVGLLFQLVESGTQQCINDMELQGTIDKAWLRASFNSLLMQETERVLLPSLIFKFKRCNQEDKAAIAHFVEARSNIVIAPDNVESNLLLGFNIILSELFNATHVDLDSLKGSSNMLHFSAGTTDQVLAFWDEWPRYQVEESTLYGYPDTDIPILILQGDMDPQTNRIWAEHAMNNFPPQTEFISLPDVAHGVLANSRQAGTDVQCGMEIMAAFVLSEGEIVDRSCLSNTVSIDFGGVKPWTRAACEDAFGEPNLW
jgi:pimeloyl-ACP methyl ester carboxylesterase